MTKKYSEYISSTRVYRTDQYVNTKAHRATNSGTPIQGTNAGKGEKKYMFIINGPRLYTKKTNSRETEYTSRAQQSEKVLAYIGAGDTHTIYLWYYMYTVGDK